MAVADPNARWKPSATVAAIAGRERDGRIEWLLVEERSQRGLVLNNPAGHLDPGESLVDAVARETLEETARRFEPTHLVGVYLARVVRSDESCGAEDFTYLRFAFGGRVGEADPARRLDEPIERTLWMTLDELRACPERHRSALVLRSIEDAAAGRRFPLDALVTMPGVERP